MAGGKKNKGQQSQQLNRKQQRNAAITKEHQNKPAQSTQPAILEEEWNSDLTYKINWLDVLAMFVVASLLCTVSMAVGVATGVSFVGTNPLAEVPMSFSQDLVQRVTTLDHDIVSHNVLVDGPQVDLDGQHHHQYQHQHHHQQMSTKERMRQTKNTEGKGKDTNDSRYYSDPAAQVHVSVQPSESKINPTLCSDGVTIGFSDWPTLKAAISEANTLSAERFIASTGTPPAMSSFPDDSFYYEEDVVFTICPGATLKARRGTLYINAENIILECEHCIMDVQGTHLAFGPHAKDVLVQGITFRGASTASLTFYHDGAEASFEDCYWIGNVGNGKIGAVADINSTSSVSFYRCEIADTKFAPRQGRVGVNGGSVATSLTIRGQDSG